MKKVIKRWTLEEDRVLWEQVNANPKSMNAAFTKVSKILGRSRLSVSGRYYTKDFRNKAEAWGNKPTVSFWKRLRNFFRF